MVQVVAAYQLASATTAARTVAEWSEAEQLTKAAAFAGVSSLGFPISEPIIATIDARVPAPLEPLPAPWWENPTLFQHAVELLIASEVADAGRSASHAEMVGHGWTTYVRVLNPPSCARCAILAGREYRWSTGFARHPGCDCQMVPVAHLEDAKRRGLVTDPREAFDRGMVRGLSKSDAQAIADGADMAKVVNATRGLGAPGITAGRTVEFAGRRIKITTDSTTKRAAWRKANPTLPFRLRPEAIYKFAESQEDAIRLLRLYGYY